MSDKISVELKIVGAPFNKGAVLHVFRHFALRNSWLLSKDSRYRIIYTTTDNYAEISKSPFDLIILSYPGVKQYFNPIQPKIPFLEIDEIPLAFPHPKIKSFESDQFIPADLLAGCAFLMNHAFLMEGKLSSDKSIFQEDWWIRAGFSKPVPLIDMWVELISNKVRKLGWPEISNNRSDKFLSKASVVLSHDVDYLPSRANNGISRIIRAMIRQIVIRRRPIDAYQIAKKFMANFLKGKPYNNLRHIAEEEGKRKIRSTFQFVTERKHKFDPSYKIQNSLYRDDIQFLISKGFEICLHGSYLSSQNINQLKNEKDKLQNILKQKVYGHRHHYLNICPKSFIVEIEKAKFLYDMSVGYNDCSGPRSGTFFPVKPFNFETSKATSFWEIPTVLMDTTLATSYNFSYNRAFSHSVDILKNIIRFKGCVSIIWHQEQMGGMLDYEYDRLYWALLDWMLANDMNIVTGKGFISSAEEKWVQTSENGDN